MARESSPRPDREIIGAAKYKGLAAGMLISWVLTGGALAAENYGLPDNKLDIRSNLASITALGLEFVVGLVAMNRGWPANNANRPPGHAETPIQIKASFPLDGQIDTTPVGVIEASSASQPGPLPEIELLNQLDNP
jgi:hypothetical protein